MAHALDISDDGRLVVFEEGNDVSRPDGYGVYLRDTDGSPPLRLGYGVSLALSPDTGWVAMLKRQFTENPELVLVPTGPGTAVSRDVGGIRVQYGSGSWVGGGPAGPEPGTLYFAGRAGDEIVRMYRLSLADGATPEAVSPPDLALAPTGHVLSADGKRLIVKPAEGPALQIDVDGGESRPVTGIAPGDLPLRFDRDGRHLYVQATFEVPAQIVRVNTMNGRRTPWRELAPLDPAGVSVVDWVSVSADGAAHVYSTRRVVSTLMVVEALE